MATRPRIEAYDQALQTLLAQLESPLTTAAELDLAIERCSVCFDELRAGGGFARSEAAFDRARGLVALLQQIAARESAETERRLRLAREASRALAAQNDAVDSDGACDFAG